MGEFLEGIGLSDNTFAQRAFDVLDDEQTEYLKFHEFCRALVVYCTFDKAALSLFAFDVFDFDGDGVLSGPDVQRAVLEVYGRDSGGNMSRLLDKAKVLAHRHSSGKAARLAEGHHFALDRRSFDMFVREVPSLCFPVFTVQRRLWETCGGMQFWRRITKERQERAKHALRALPGQGASYEYKDWRELVEVMGTPTSRQKQSLKKLGLTTPTAATAGASKGRRHSAFEFASAAGAAQGGGGARSRRGSMGATSHVEAGGSVLRRELDSKRGISVGGSVAGDSAVTTSSAAKRRAIAWESDGGSVRGARRSSAASGTGTGLGRESSRTGPVAPGTGADEGGPDGAPADLTEVPSTLRGLTKHQMATVSVFGSAAERRAAAAAMGGVTKAAEKQQARRRRSLAADNLEAIRAMTGEEAYEAEHYKKMNKVGRQASAKAAQNRRRSLEATAARTAQAARRPRASAAGALGSRPPGGVFGTASASAPGGSPGAKPRARRSSLAVSRHAPGRQRGGPGASPGVSPGALSFSAPFSSPSGAVVAVRSGGGVNPSAGTASPGRSRRPSQSVKSGRSRRSSVSGSPVRAKTTTVIGGATSRHSFGGSPHGQARRVAASPVVELGF